MKFFGRSVRLYLFNGGRYVADFCPEIFQQLHRDNQLHHPLGFAVQALDPNLASRTEKPIDTIHFSPRSEVLASRAFLRAAGAK
jgi:hypothetical protein